MYNGIGITTPRGTGTNGYVQRNLSFVNTKRERVEYVKDSDIKKLETLIERKGNAEILEHEKKRRIELKCAEMRDLMLNNDYEEEIINQKVKVFRKTLIEREGLYETAEVQYDEHGRPIAKETHQLAQANDQKNRKLREALGLGEFNPKEAVKRKAEEEKEAERRKIELASKRYTIVQDDDDDDEQTPPPPPKVTVEEKPSDDEEETASKEKKKKKKKDKEDGHHHHHRSRDEKKRKASPDESNKHSSRKHISKKNRDESSDEEESRHHRHRERSPRR